VPCIVHVLYVYCVYHVCACNVCIVYYMQEAHVRGGAQVVAGYTLIPYVMYYICHVAYTYHIRVMNYTYIVYYVCFLYTIHRI
jgi:hypothetical protein